MMDDRLFDQARDRVPCEDVAGRRVKLAKVGAGWRGVCPLKDCGTKSKQSPFVVFGDGRKWKCWSCDPRGGDVVDLEHRLFSRGGETIRDAALRLVGGIVAEETEESRERRAQAAEAREREAMADAAWKTALAARLWREGQPSEGTLVQTYLESRAIRGPVLARALKILRFHPWAYHSGDPEAGVRLPAMLNICMTELGPTGGIHATYLAPNGRGKTHRSPAKRMWGPQGLFLLARRDGGFGPPVRVRGEPLEGYVLRGGYWLSRPDAPGPLAGAEGQENALSRAMMLAGELSLPVRAVAAGSLDSLQGYELKDGDNVLVDAWGGTGDPMRPPFTWPEDPLAPWGVVDIACDSDMSPVTVQGRSGKNRVGKSRAIDIRREASERARICGRLATAAWRRRLAPGSETVVRASAPPPDLDFNDMIRAAEAAGNEAAA
ncbi:MAG: CHC2 zinc finger domain-containing protein [Brevundimonas sp.]